MLELPEALTLFTLAATAFILACLPTVIYRLARPSTRIATAEALAVADAIREELTALVEQVKEQTEALEGWADAHAATREG